MPMLEQHQIDEAAALLGASHRPTALTGAGVSKESGIPTFRDALDGLWARYNPMELATPTAFKANPGLVWAFYEYRRGLGSSARPNPGHTALAALEGLYPSFPIITQNVDDLHEQAGSTQVIHLHGSITRNKCSANCQGAPTLVDVHELDTGEAGPPACPHCGRLVRPDVVWFGEALPTYELQAAQAAVQAADLMLVVGTSGVVSPAADLPYLAKRRQAHIIEVNPDESQITPIADVWLAAPAGEALPRLVDAVRQLRDGQDSFHD